MRVGLREANQNFSKLIKKVRAGKEVILTDRGKPVARLTALPDLDDNEDAVMKRLEREGLLKLPTKRGLMPPFKGYKLRGGPSIVQTLREMRDEEDG